MRRILFGVTVPVTANMFLRDQLAQLASNQWDVHLATAPGPGFENLAELTDTHVHPLPMQRNPAPLRDLMSALSWRRLVRNLRPDIVVASTPKAGLLASLAARQQRVPVRVYHVRGLRAEGLRGFARDLGFFLERLTVSNATDVVCDSASLRSSMQVHGLLPADRGIVLGHGSCCGVNIGHFRPPSLLDRKLARDNLHLNDDDFVVGYVGRLTEDKGVADLIDAVASLRKLAKNVRLVLVGPSEYRSIIGRICAAVDAGWVIAPGPVFDPRSSYWAFDLFCLPSRREGFPIAPLEAQACAVPVITTTATGCIDSVEAGVTGLVVEPGDVKSLAAAIRGFIGSETKLQEMGAAARDRVVRDFDQRDVNRHWMEYLNGLCPESAKADGR